MASTSAIAAVNTAILQLLKSRETETSFGSLACESYDISEFDNEIQNGFSLCLWRVTINGSRRALPPRRLPDGRAFRPSLPIDLHYVLTPWGADTDTKLRMLGWAMRVLEDTPVLPAGILNHNQPDPNTFSASEVVELICDPLSVTDLFNLWDKLKNKLHVSMTYLVRGVNLDSQQDMPEHPQVQTRVLEVGRRVP